MKICVIGTGYVGLVTGACLADLGNRVVCVDKNEEKIRGLQKGIIPIYEPGLQEFVNKNQKNGRLKFTANTAEGVKTSDVIFIAVGTPSKDNGEADLSGVEAVAKDIAKSMNGYKIVVEKSTVPVRTGEWVKRTLKLYNSNSADFDVVSVPEFLREGSAVHDFMHQDRIVVGVESERAKEIMIKLFKPLDVPLLITDIKSAELIKHASNSFLALKISYINAIANVCELVGADVVKVAEGMGYDKRIGREFLDAGVGYGGSCFPKDVAAFIKIVEDVGYDFKLLKNVEEINKLQRVEIAKKLKEALWILNDKTIGILGLSFKPNTDDMRDAPSIDIISSLQKEGAKIKAYDPVAMENAKKVLRDVQYCRDPYEVSSGSDALLIITEWEEFTQLDLAKIKGLLNIPIVIDGRNIYEPGKMKELGFLYRGVGR